MSALFMPTGDAMSSSTTRREFLRNTALTGAALGLSGLCLTRTSPVWAAAEGSNSLNVLVLGGTGQTGPHLIQELLDRGHAVTMFNRGNRSEKLFPTVECLVGDRDPEAAEGLKALDDAVAAGRRWDVCIDIWPHIPKIVERTAMLLRENVDHFMYVSSISVYVDNSLPGADENAAVGEAPDADEMEYGNQLFGPFKAECENRVRRIFPDNHTIFRPGLIVGPRDFSFRGGYWPVRVRRGGEVLAPGDGSDRLQIIDGRDLTSFQARCMEGRIGGTFNVTGPHPDTPLTAKSLLEGCREAAGSDATFVWADGAFLEEQGIGPWMDMPCWIPAEGEYAGFGERSVDKAVAAGLAFRPLSETVTDTLAWFDGLPEDRREGLAKRAGLTAEREQAALAAWHEAKG